MKTWVSSGDSIRSDGGLLRTGQLELRQAFGFGLVLALLSLLGALADRFEQLLLFVLDELLAVGEARFLAALDDVGELRHQRCRIRRPGR